MTNLQIEVLAKVINKSMPTSVTRPELANKDAKMIAGQWIMMRDAIAEFCQYQNLEFNKAKFISDCSKENNDKRTASNSSR